MKCCAACGERLSAAAFNDSSRTPDGLARICRACTNARRRARQSPAKAGKRSPAAEFARLLREGNVEAMQVCLRAGIRPDWSWVCETMRGGHLELAQLLLEAGAEVNLITLAATGDAKGVRAWLTESPQDARAAIRMEPGCEAVTPLHVACAVDLRRHAQGADVQVQVVRLLIDSGADLNARARYRGLDDATPLFCACWSSESLKLVIQLLEQGAVAAARDLYAALGHFQRHGRDVFDIADALLNAGVSLECEPGERTLLRAAAHQGNRRSVAWLLARGADVSVRGPGGRTAAHFAAERNTGTATLALLAEFGADLAARDDDGRTPLDLARLHEKRRVAEWIETQPGYTSTQGSGRPGPK